MSLEVQVRIPVATVHAAVGPCFEVVVRKHRTHSGLHVVAEDFGPLPGSPIFQEELLLQEAGAQYTGFPREASGRSPPRSPVRSSSCTTRMDLGKRGCWFGRRTFSAPKLAVMVYDMLTQSLRYTVQRIRSLRTLRGIRTLTSLRCESMLTISLL